MDMSQAIKQARKDKGMTQIELAAALGCSDVSVYNWEAGRRKPLPVYLAALEKVLGVELKEVRDVEDQDRPSPPE